MAVLSFVLCCVFVLCVYVQAEGPSRLQQLKKDTEEIQDIMLDNVIRAGERKERLEELDNRAEELLKHVNTNG